MIRCPFCSAAFDGDYPVKTVGVHTVLCQQCNRAFVIVVNKHWWGYGRDVHVR